MSPIVTLTTDFGQSDYDAGVLSGVIWSIAPDVQIVDLSHEITRHNVLEASLLLDRCTPYFPRGTIHVGVVDPGVGTRRRPIAARLGDQLFVGPDNGLITLMQQRAISTGLPVEIVHLNRPGYWLAQVSYIFHGRDVFAAVGGHLAAGIPLQNLGDPLDDPVLLDLPEPVRTKDGWRGVVMQIDTFGNLSTNLCRTHLRDEVVLEVRLKKTRIQGLVKTFGEKKPGELGALFDSSGKLCVCVVNGSAAARLGSRVGDAVEVIFG
jgi:S-adenosylmethionine hydrolase